MSKNANVQHALAAYIPMDRRQAYARGQTLPERTTGAALFADISGFTPLTEALARDLGPQRGAEELTRQLNLVYDALIAQVDRYGGSVIGFSGDAITCWFDDGLPQADSREFAGTRRAAACAFAMQAGMSRFAAIVTPSGKQVALAMKVAVASGPVRRFLVGDPRVQIIDVLAGATLVRLAAAEHLAGRGEVVLSAESLSALGEAAAILEWRQDPTEGHRCAVIGGLMIEIEPTPWPILADDALGEEQVRPWALPPVYDRMHSGQGVFLTELRPAVSLFMRFGGIDYDADARAGDKLDAFIRRVQTSLTTCAGVLIQLTIGDKGSYLYAAFGAPIAHEDNAQRAVRVALELCSLPAELSFVRPVQIGISQGTMRTGDYGGTTRRTYGVLGDEVNLSARLMQHAGPDQVLVSQRVQRGLADAFEWETRAPIQVKGKSEPVPIYRLLGVQRKSASSERQTTIIGREQEQSILADSLRRLASGAGGVVIIEGEAGMGKALLADDLRRQAASLGLDTLTGVASEVDRSTPYYVWRGVFNQLFELGAAQDANRAQQVLGMLQDQPEVLRLAPLLNPVLPFEFPENEYTIQMTGQERANRTRQLLTQLLDDLAQFAPQVVILEDAHWLDSLSWELTLQTARTLVQASPLMLVLVTRPMKEGEAGAASMHTLQAGAATRLIRLGPLSPEATVAIAAARLGVPNQQLPQSVAALIRQQAEGNPFYAEEMVLTLRDQRLIAVEPVAARAGTDRPNRCVVLGDLDRATRALPDTIQGLILARIDRLAPEKQLPLKVATVIGRTFAYSPLRHILGDYVALGDQDLRTHLTDLAMLDLIASVAASDDLPKPDLAYMFKQIVTQEAAYQTLLFAQRQQLHRAVAEWYEANSADRLDELATMLAFHYARADVEAKAIEYLMRAGARAHALYAVQEATEHYQQALRLVQKTSLSETLDQRQIIHAALGELLTIAGQYEQAKSHLEQALTLAAARENTEAQAHVCRWLARLHELRGEYPFALEWIQRGLAVLDGRETTEAAELRLIAGLIHSRQGDQARALDECHRALHIAEQSSAVSVLGRANNLLGHIALLRGQSAVAVKHFQQALDLYQRIGDLNGQALANNQLARAFYQTGQWPTAESHYRQARAMFDKMGDVYNRSFADNNLAEILLKRGDVDGALASYEQALESLERIGGSAYVVGALHNNLGAAFIRRAIVSADQASAAAAREHLATSQRLFDQAQARDFLPEMNRHLAELASFAGDWAEAEARARQALDLARELDMRGEEGCSLRVLGQVAAAQKRLDLAHEHLGQSIAILEQVEDEYEHARSQLALAQLHAARGHGGSASEMLDQCMPTLKRLGARLDLTAARALQANLASRRKP